MVTTPGSPRGGAKKIKKKPTIPPAAAGASLTTRHAPRPNTAPIPAAASQAETQETLGTDSQMRQRGTHVGSKPEESAAILQARATQWKGGKLIHPDDSDVDDEDDDEGGAPTGTQSTALVHDDGKTTAALSAAEDNDVLATLDGEIAAYKNNNLVLGVGADEGEDNWRDLDASSTKLSKTKRELEYSRQANVDYRADLADINASVIAHQRSRNKAMDFRDEAEHVNAENIAL
ncbi:uncharacterized protein BDZ99DRAFT_577682 [Mytilinidion resinicola]|uniref:Uncharacterized protein n=1 Tax=Mytilinidion resinicola TaxID=574789 RepID=A0A6A6XYB0_9PEZI|nr:uncharacterized protein BDZ99DRAFT_577682 [Mytilinidion resinicola]KAF2801410.1 hypothetical protein BDZ99DRAFT_577682 [Mytilinidion resinicola]